MVDSDGKVEKVETDIENDKIEIDDISRSLIVSALNQLKAESEQYLEQNSFDEANINSGSPIISGNETYNELPNLSIISNEGTDSGILQNISTDLDRKYDLVLNYQLNNIIIQIANSPDFFIAKIGQFKDESGLILINQITSKKENMDANDVIVYIKEQLKNKLLNAALAILEKNN